MDELEEHARALFSEYTTAVNGNHTNIRNDIRQAISYATKAAQQALSQRSSSTSVAQEGESGLQQGVRFIRERVIDESMFQAGLQGSSVDEFGRQLRP